jgi:hypothetical protein
VIQIDKERVIPLSKIGDYLPRGRQNKKVHAATGYRWARRGLETIRRGGMVFTSVEALQRYFDRLSAGPAAGADAAQAPTPAPTPSARQAAAERADRALAAMGV